MEEIKKEINYKILNGEIYQYRPILTNTIHLEGRIDP